LKNAHGQKGAVRDSYLLAPEMGARAQASGKRAVRASLTVSDCNPEAVEKALMNKA
jgi:hypothetical protein